MKRILTVMALAALVMTACSKDESTTASAPGSIVIDPTVIEMPKTQSGTRAVTRATDVDFEDNDAIGVTITMAGDKSVYADNAKFIYSTDKFTSSDNLLWYTDVGLKSNIVAYHPYAATVPTEFTVQADQTGAGYTQSDLMIATKEDVTPSVSATNMTFYHKLTKLVINTDNQTGGEITAVMVKGTIPTATVDMPTQAVALKESATPADIKASVKTASKQYYAIIVPQKVAVQLAVTVKIGSTEKTLSQTYTKMDLVKGKYTINIKVMPDKIAATISGNIEDWGDNGDIEPADGPSFEEFDDHFVYDEVSYKIVTMKDGRKWMADNLRYVPEGVIVSTNPADKDAKIWAPYTSDGTTCTPVTDAAEIAKLGYLYAVETALGGEITPENGASFEGARGLCPKGWHIPTQLEWIGLVGKTNKNAEGVDLSDTSAPYYDAGYTGGKISAMDADGFNFTNAGCMNRSTIAATGAYQKNIYPNPGGKISLNYLMCSTLYKNSYSTTDATLLTNIQFFSPMTLYAAASPEGKLSVAYLGYKSGCGVRCIKDKAN